MERCPHRPPDPYQHPPYVTQGQLAAISYTSDLEKAKENSYTLYASARSVEDAKQAMDDARREEGKNSYQYKMAEYTYQSTLYQNDATIAEFELSFQSLYKALAPAQPRCRPRRVPWPMRNRSMPWQSESTSWATSRTTPFWTLRTR